MKFYVHVGIEKTGTTAIQKFLELNRDRLAAEGYFVPESMGRTNHRKLPVAAYTSSRRDDFTRLNGIYSDEALSAYQQTVIADLERELRTTQCDKVILSSEQIQSRLTTEEEICRLKEMLTGVGATDIVIVIYLRDPGEIANSYYSTWIRCGGTDREPPGPEHQKLETLCGHRATLERFASCFDESSVIVKIFDPASFKNGSLIEDFLEAVECPCSPRFEAVPPTNQPLSILGLEILRRFNQKVPVFLEDRPNPLRGNIVKFINRRFVADRGEAYVMAESLYRRYQEAFRDSNEYVRKHWFPDRPRLFPEKGIRKARPLSVPDADLDRIVGLLVDIWSEKHGRLVSLRERLSLMQRISTFLRRKVFKRPHSGKNFKRTYSGKK